MLERQRSLGLSRKTAAIERVPHAFTVAPHIECEQPVRHALADPWRRPKNHLRAGYAQVVLVACFKRNCAIIHATVLLPRLTNLGTVLDPARPYECVL
jgi:hypothetical protein